MTILAYEAYSYIYAATMALVPLMLCPPCFAIELIIVPRAQSVNSIGPSRESSLLIVKIAAYCKLDQTADSKKERGKGERRREEERY